MSTLTYKQDPEESKDYQIDWTDRLLSGETISASTWVVGTGLTKGSSSSTTTTAKIWLSGGTVGSIYPVVNRITTTDGRVYEHAFNVRCMHSYER